MEEEYIIGLHNREDLESFYNEMETEYGSGNIPGRPISLAKRRAISRNTHYYLTAEEALLIENDPRVASVVLANDPNIKVVPIWTQTDNYVDYPTSSGPSHWGLYRTITGEIWNSNLISETLEYNQSGKNVDIVIVDGHINLNHPEFFDDQGNTRVNQINWHIYSSEVDGNPLTTNYSYLPYSGNTNTHGTAVASVACGKKFGIAKEANIYNIYPYTDNGDSNNLNVEEVFDYIRVWHNNKPINPETGVKNPTICNLSWEWSTALSVANITAVKFNGTVYSPSSWSSNPAILANYGLNYDGNSATVRVPAGRGDTYLDIEDAKEDGIILVSAASNDNKLLAKDSSHRYYDDYVQVSNVRYFSHRGGLPSSNTLAIGGVSNLVYEGLQRRSKQALDGYSGGEGVSLLAPGTIISAAVNDNIGLGGTIYTYSAGHFYQFVRGQSFAAALATGVAACVLEKYPEMTHTDIENYLKYYAKKNQLYDNGVVYPDSSDLSLYEAPNEILYAHRDRSKEGMTFPKSQYSYKKTEGITFPRTQKRRRF